MAALAFGLSGCSTLRYLWQAGRGQLSLVNHAKPVDEVLKDPRTTPRLKRLLSEIALIKKFGESQGLKPTKNYQEFVQLDRPAVVWVVSASEALKFKSKEWGFPVVGRFNYLGWFGREDALSYAQELRKEGLDVDVRGASAYSTLGWFRDPILSTMISDGDDAFGELVNTIIHESVHATLYINDESYFNESIASFVADILTPVYLAQSTNVTEAEKSAYLQMGKDSEARGIKLKAAYAKLDQLYNSNQDETEKLKQKQLIYSQLKDDLHFKRDINNATLIQYRTYGVGQKEFQALYEKHQKRFGAFFGDLLKLKRENFTSPQTEDFTGIF